EHVDVMALLDTNHDGVLSLDELARGTLIGTLLTPDVDLFDDKGAWAPAPKNAKPDSLSIAISFHLVPCASGRCSTAMVKDHCDDRARDGDETDVDCGGSCIPCRDAAVCLVAGDCLAGRCDAGRCGAPTCTNGVRDATESDVDCGNGCKPCFPN